MSFPARIPIHSFQGIFNPVWGNMSAFLYAKGDGDGNVYNSVQRFLPFLSESPGFHVFRNISNHNVKV